jgi:hypothetical protein
LFVLRFPKNVDKKFNTIIGLHKRVKPFLGDNMKALTEHAHKRILEHIDKQDLGWKPLKENYKNRKIRIGHDERIWVATGLLKDSIEVMQLTDENLWFVGIPSGKKYPDKDVEIALVASVLEYGSPSRNIPPRPLFRTTRIEIRREIKVMMKKRNLQFLKKITRDAK